MEWLQRHDHDGETSKPILGEWDLTVFAHYPLIYQEKYLLSFSFFGVMMTSICFYLFSVVLELMGLLEGLIWSFISLSKFYPEKITYCTRSDQVARR